MKSYYYKNTSDIAIMIPNVGAVEPGEVLTTETKITHDDLQKTAAPKVETKADDSQANTPEGNE